MKRTTLASLVATALMISGAMTLSFAQGGPGKNCNGRGYGGPPQSQEERAARQAACLERNGGVCPNGGPRTNCPAGKFSQGKGMRQGMGQGMGQGHCGRHGLRDGTGPRSANGTCPNMPAQPKK